MRSRLLIAGITSFTAALGALTAASTAGAVTVTITNPDPIIIPERFTGPGINFVAVSSFIDTSGIGITNITDVDIVLNGITHSAAQTLAIALIYNTPAPGGLSSVLTGDDTFSDLAWSDNTVRFSDDGGALTYGVDGTYATAAGSRGTSPLAVFNGLSDLSGNYWQLFISYTSVVSQDGLPPIIPGGVISDGWSLILTGDAASATPVPVPAAAVMFMSGLAGLGGLRLRKRKKAQA